MLERDLTIFSREYCCEELADVERDVSEAFDVDINPRMKEVPIKDDMPSGVFTVTITWEAE